MLITTRTSSTKAKWALKQATTVQKDVADLAAQVKKFDGKTGVDTNPEIGQVDFSKKELKSDLVSGAVNGSASIVGGKLDSFALSTPEKDRVAGFSRSNGNTYSWAPVSDGSMTVVQAEDGSKRVHHNKLIDPNTPKEKLQHSLGNALTVAVQTATTAIPLVGLGAVTISNMCNDSNQGYQMTSMLGNVVGTGALILGGLAASPVLLGLAGVSLLTAGVSAGMQAAEEAPSNFTEPLDSTH